jgi:hypothetical protein
VGAADDSLPGQAGGVVRTRLGLVDLVCVKVPPRQVVRRSWVAAHTHVDGRTARGGAGWRGEPVARRRGAGWRGWLVAAAGLRVTRASQLSRDTLVSSASTLDLDLECSTPRFD